MDSIILRNLSTQARIGLDCWGRDRPQPLLITVIVTTDTAPAAYSDRAGDLSIDYSALGKGILSHVESKSKDGERGFESLYHLALVLAEDVIPRYSNGVEFSELKITLTAPKQLLCADGLEVQLFRAGNQAQARDVISIKDLQANLVLGINSHERLLKQRILANVSLDVQQSFLDWAALLNTKLISLVLEFLEKSERFTLEALATDIAQEIYDKIHYNKSPPPTDSIDSISVRVEKPSGTTSGESTGLQITRKSRWLASRRRRPSMAQRVSSGLS